MLHSICRDSQQVRDKEVPCHQKGYCSRKRAAVRDGPSTSTLPGIWALPSSDNHNFIKGWRNHELLNAMIAIKYFILPEYSLMNETRPRESTLQLVIHCYAGLLRLLLRNHRLRSGRASCPVPVVSACSRTGRWHTGQRPDTSSNHGSTHVFF